AVIKLPDLSVKAPAKNAIILDGIQDPGNMGTIVRTAIACGYEDIYLLSCVDPFSPKAVRSSMSGVYFAKFHKCDYSELFNAIEKLELIVADFGGENLFNYKPQKAFAVAIGNEGNGISETLKSRANTVLTIPMDSKIESLNASVASALMMYELNRNMK
ncbi:MAG: RNA methyltransferase, partial [Clostridia bacterium]|nr:RNA methyltransferase [Clostridia bacterium]